MIKERFRVTKFTTKNGVVDLMNGLKQSVL